MKDARDAPALDWRALMRAGLCHLRLPPAVFWALTPAELRLMLGQDSGDRPLARDGLQTWQVAYPRVNFIPSFAMRSMFGLS